MDVTEVAQASSGRMFSSGLMHLLIGVTWSIGPIVGFFADTGEMKPDAWLVAVVVILWPLGVPILLRGIGLLQQALGKTGYFRASPAGIELRLGGRSLYAALMSHIPQIRVLPANPDTFPIRFPQDGARWDGSAYVYVFPWTAIASFDVTMFALIIELRSGARLLLRRFYFVENSLTVARRLAEITHLLRATHPLPGGEPSH